MEKMRSGGIPNSKGRILLIPLEPSKYLEFLESSATLQNLYSLGTLQNSSDLAEPQTLRNFPNMCPKTFQIQYFQTAVIRLKASNFQIYFQNLQIIPEPSGTQVMPAVPACANPPYEQRPPKRTALSEVI